MFRSGGSGASAKWINVLLIVTIAGVVALGFWLSGSDDRGERSDEPRTVERVIDTSRSVTRGELKPGEQWVGGIKRPATDLSLASGQTPGTPGAAAAGSPGDAVDDAESKQRDPFDYGVTPPVRADANAQTKAVSVAAKSGEHPERLNVLTRGAAFDPRKYREDEGYRTAYLNTPEPGRVFASAQPGKDVPVIRQLSPRYQQIVQGGSIKLRASIGSTGQGMPVTFASLDLGRFAGNKLTTITVEADAGGIAEAEFEATPGTIEDVRIMAASPVASGQSRFVVNVKQPGGDDSAAADRGPEPTPAP